MIAVVSCLCSLIYVYMWHKHFDITFSMMFTIIPLSNLGFVMYAESESLREAVIATKIEYLGGAFLQYFIMLSVFNLCQIRVPKWFKTALFALSAVLYGSVLSIGYSDLFYRDMSFSREGGAAVLERSYGPMHTVFFIVVFAYFLISFAVALFTYLSSRQVPRTIVGLLLVPVLVCIMSYIVEKALDLQVELVPVGYLIAELTYLLIAYKVNMYDIADTAVDSIAKEGNIGFVTFDFRKRYLGSNNAAKSILPELEGFAVDSKPDESTETGKLLNMWLDRFSEDESRSRFTYTVKDPGGDPEADRIYNVEAKYLYDDERKRGYMLDFTDDTERRKYIELLGSYNEDLQKEVDSKTKHIVEMHDNLIMSLAMMVESRDNSTGGHIMRTSEGVRILMDEIMKDSGIRYSAAEGAGASDEEKGGLTVAGASDEEREPTGAGMTEFSDEFCKDIIKAAPMHDLGKIAVDDAVLRKPGRFTPEEFEKMKKHPEEGARVIHKILLNTDDDSFKKVAENVAHYHHERWDGSGYPCGLAGPEIPVEARIMAVADVYDALVSKRVYKESMSFEQADSIIMEGMGTQFDPALKKYYEAARPRLEAYYSTVQDETE